MCTSYYATSTVWLQHICKWGWVFIFELHGLALLPLGASWRSWLCHSFSATSWAPNPSPNSRAAPTSQTMLVMKHCGGQVTALGGWKEPCNRKSSSKTFRPLPVSLRTEKCIESRTHSANTSVNYPLCTKLYRIVQHCTQYRATGRLPPTQKCTESVQTCTGLYKSMSVCICNTFVHICTSLYMPTD